MTQMPAKGDLDVSLEHLLVDVGRQNRASFSALYEATAARLFAVLIRILRDQEQAADVLQDVYLAVWRRAARFDPGKGKALNWLATVTRNAGIDALRKRKNGHVSDDCCAEIAADQRSAFDNVNDNHTAILLRQKLHALPPLQRQAVKLFYLDDLSIIDTANKMQAPVNTAKSWIRRGVLRLQVDFTNKHVTDFLS